MRAEIGRKPLQTMERFDEFPLDVKQLIKMKYFEEYVRHSVLDRMRRINAVWSYRGPSICTSSLLRQNPGEVLKFFERLSARFPRLKILFSSELSSYSRACLISVYGDRMRYTSLMDNGGFASLREFIVQNICSYVYFDRRGWHSCSEPEYKALLKNKMKDPVFVIKARGCIFDVIPARLDCLLYKL